MSCEVSPVRFNNAVGLEQSPTQKLLEIKEIDGRRAEDLHVRLLRAIVQGVMEGGEASLHWFPSLLEAMARHQLEEARNVFVQEAAEAVAVPGRRSQVLEQCRCALDACITQRKAGSRLAKEWLAGGSRMPDLMLRSLCIGSTVDLVTGVSQELQNGLGAWRQGVAAVESGMMKTSDHQLQRLELYVTEARRAHAILLEYVAQATWPVPEPVASVLHG